MAISNILLYFTSENEEERTGALISYKAPDTIDYEKRLLNMTDFEYIIPQTRCFVNISGRKQAPFIVVLIHSAPIKISQRQALRETWIHSNPNMLSYFVMGKPESPSLQKRIFAENAKHNDIIQGNFADTYHNLTYKHTMLLKWFDSYCPKVKHLIKSDDDVYVNVPNVFRYLDDNKSLRYSIMGYYRKPETVQRFGKWKISYEQNYDDHIPEYVIGSTIIYSNQFARDAFRRSFTTRFYWVCNPFDFGLIAIYFFTDYYYYS